MMRVPAWLVAIALLPATLACGRGDGTTGEARPSETGPARAGEGTGDAAAGGADEAAGEAGEPGDTDGASGLEDPDSFEAKLYFPDPAGQLRPERRRMPRGLAPPELARLLIEALLEGPRGGLTPAVPAGSSLKAIHIAEGGTAFVDMDAAFARGLSRGSEDALLAVWSITDTLAANVAGVRRVKILIDGEESRSLGGHLDLTRPFESTLTAAVEAGALPRDGRPTEKAE